MTGAARDALAAHAVDDARASALLLRHREDDALDLAHLLLGVIATHLAQRLVSAGKHAQNLSHAAHLANLLHLGKHVVHREALAQHPLGFGGGSGVGVGLGRLDDAHDITHAEDALGHAVRVENLEGLGLLAHGDELDGLARHGADGQCATAAGVAVELGHDDTVEVSALGELGNDVDDVLTSHRVDDHEDLVGLDRALDVDGLLHHELVDLETSSGIDDDHVAEVVDCLLDGLARDRDGVLAVTAVDRHANLAAEGLELVSRGGTVRVARGELRRVALLLEHVGKLGARGGLAGALQANEHDHVGRAVGHERELALSGAEKLCELGENDLDDVLRRRQRGKDLGREALLLAAGHEVLDHAKVDVCLKQRHANLAHCRVDIVLREATLATQLVEGVCEAV